MKNFKQNSLLSPFIKITPFLIPICLICTGLAFATIWRNLEKQSRTRRFCLFVTSLIYYFLGHYWDLIVSKIIVLETKGYIGLSLICGLVSWGLSYFYNCMEYILILPVLACSMVPAYFLGRFLKSKMEICWALIIYLCTLLIPVVATFVFVWNRKRYLRTYRITFASLISLSTIASVLVDSKSYLRNDLNYFVIVCFTALTAFLGIKNSK